MAENNGDRKKASPPTIQYVISESGPPNRTLVFDSAAQTDEGIMRAAHKVIAGTIENENDRMPNGFTVFRSTPVGQHTPALPDENEEPPQTINPYLELVKAADATPDTPKSQIAPDVPENEAPPDEAE